MSEEIRYGLGWLPEFPDYRDYPATKLLATAPSTKLPEAFSLRSKAPPVRDQGNIGSCTGFAWTTLVATLQRTDQDPYNTLYSALAMYYFGRIEDGMEWREQDVGAYVRDGAKVLARDGIMPESKWPYKPERFADQPSPSALKEMRRWKSGPYYRCGNLDQIIRAIALGYPVVGGFSCFTNMFTSEVARTGIIPLPGGKFAGGHAVCFLGYDLMTRRLEFQNSWGRWGNQGYGYLPFDYVDRGWATDFWCVTKESVDTKHDRLFT